MAKRGPKPKIQTNATLPDNVEFVNVQIPYYTGELDRPRIFRLDARFSSLEESDNFNRIYHAMLMLEADPNPKYSQKFSQNSAIRQLFNRVREAAT